MKSPGMNYETTISGADIAITPEDDEFTRARSRRRIIIAIILAAALIGGYVAYKAFGGAGSVAEADGAAQAPVVTVTIPGKQDVVRTINATGTLAARREIPVSVVGEGGRVTNVYVDAGDWVKQGQVMASIDRSVQTQQAAALEAQIGSARAELDLAQANLNRAAQLVERGFISKADIDRLTATKDSAGARVRVAQAQLAETRARNARLNIIAPVGGFVLMRSVEPGATVTQGSGVLFTLAQGGEMELRAQLSEDDLANVSVGTSAEINPVGTTSTLSGQIWQIAPVIDEQSRQGIARIALGYDKTLRPGGFASAKIRSGSTSAAVLPESAVMNDAKGSFVYIIGSDDKVMRRAVETGEITSAGVSVVSGLSGSERVVLRAGGFLNEGEKVRPERDKNVAAK